MPDEFEQVEVQSREDLRRWLKRHHGRAESIWLVTFKKPAGDAYLPYDDLVEEALCFGWIDSRPKALDAERSMRLLSPRKTGSAWSRANRERVERLIGEGLMAPAGLARVEAAKRDGSWDRLAAVEAGVVPGDLRAALRRHRGATAHFEAFPPSSKRIILEWIESAKRPETRANRIAETAEKAARNERANHYP